MGDFTVTLASIGTFGKFQASLQILRRDARALGFNRTLLWETHATIEQHMLRRGATREQVQRLRSDRHRPWCNAHKALILLEAMRQTGAEDFVMWMDAKYASVGQYFGSRHLVSRPVDVRAAILALKKTASPDGIYGIVACPADCTRKMCMHNRGAYPQVTLEGYGNLLRDVSGPFLDQAHILNSNIVLRNTRANKELVQDRLRMALTQPDAFCAADTQDQAAWTILVRSRRLPLVNLCSHLNISFRNSESMNCHRYQKSANVLLHALERGRFQVLSDMKLASLNCSHALKDISLPPTLTPSLQRCTMMKLHSLKPVELPGFRLQCE